MNAYEEMRHYQTEWDNDQRRQRLDTHGEIITTEDLRAWKKHWEDVGETKRMTQNSA